MLRACSVAGLVAAGALGADAAAVKAAGAAAAGAAAAGVAAAPDGEDAGVSPALPVAGDEPEEDEPALEAAGE